MIGAASEVHFSRNHKILTRGQVLVGDGDAVIDIARCEAATLRRVRRLRIAMVFQQFALLPWRTVRENVGFGLELLIDPLEGAPVHALGLHVPGRVVIITDERL